MNDEMKQALDAVLSPDIQHETVAMARALLPFAEEATDALVLVCVGLVEARGDEKSVAEYLGFEVGRLRRLLQSRLSGRILKALAREKLSGQGYMIGVFTLMNLAESQSQTGTARRNAALSLVELAEAEHQKAADKGEDTKDLNAMTLAELEAYVNTIKQDLIPPPAKAIEHTQD